MKEFFMELIQIDVGKTGYSLSMNYSKINYLTFINMKENCFYKYFVHVYNFLITNDLDGNQ